ncbi:MAG: AMP-binding protein [Hyphomicrobiaceae bacterium]|nr:AMP-binding protein [Hyphomicrobiaceae bacterium]
MLPRLESYEAVRKAFVWQVPERYNIGLDIADKWGRAEPDRPAILTWSQTEGAGEVLTFGQFAERSSRLASHLAARGVVPGARVAVILPQVPETAIVHAALFKLGAISVPLSERFGTDALEHRLRDCGARLIIGSPAALSKVIAVSGTLADLDRLICLDGATEGAEALLPLLSGGDGGFKAHPTGPDDPALMIYTSGTTGPAKGALHGHRVVLGHLPGMEMPHDLFPEPGDLLWTPADWAWAGGMLNILMPGLHFGVPVVSARLDRFEPETALRLMSEMKVRNAFIPPTALRMMREVESPRARFDLALRTIGSGGEALGREAYEWGRRELGVTVNEFYGQTECNLVLASSHRLGVSRAGMTGKPVPGHDVAVIRADGSLCDPHETGQIAVRRPDPVMFLGYWNNEAATKAKFIGDWMMTGDEGFMDEEGYFGFVGRDDDVITSSGHRIGPGEVEDCLLSHPAVALAAAVGKPDPLRTEIVKAFVVLKPGHRAGPEIETALKDHVRARLAAHEYPREFAFVDSLPLTTTGKVIRRLLRDEDR